MIRPKQQIEGNVLDSADSGYGIVVASGEQNIEPSIYVNGKEYADLLIVC